MRAYVCVCVCACVRACVLAIERKQLYLTLKVLLHLDIFQDFANSLDIKLNKSAEPI